MLWVGVYKNCWASIILGICGNHLNHYLITTYTASVCGNNSMDAIVRPHTKSKFSWVVSLICSKSGLIVSQSVSGNKMVATTMTVECELFSNFQMGYTGKTKHCTALYTWQQVSK